MTWIFLCLPFPKCISNCSDVAQQNDCHILKARSCSSFKLKSEMVVLICVLSICFLPWRSLQKCLVTPPWLDLTLVHWEWGLAFLIFLAWLSLAAITLSFAVAEVAFHSDCFEYSHLAPILPASCQDILWLLFIHSRWNHDSFNVFIMCMWWVAFLPISSHSASSFSMMLSRVQSPVLIFIMLFIQVIHELSNTLFSWTLEYMPFFLFSCNLNTCLYSFAWSSHLLHHYTQYFYVKELHDVPLPLWETKLLKGTPMFEILPSAPALCAWSEQCQHCHAVIPRCLDQILQSTTNKIGTFAFCSVQIFTVCVAYWGCSLRIWQLS